MYVEPGLSYRRYLPVAGMILFFIVGFLAAYFWMNARAQKASKDCADNLAKVKKTESGLPQAPDVKVPNEIFSISGKVEKIDGQKITVKSLAFGEEKIYQVTIGPDTKIIKREMDLSPPKEGNANTLATPKETEVSLSDIRTGDNLAVDSADNIKDKTEFTAKNIYIDITTGLPTPPPAPDINSAPTAPSPSDSGLTAPPAPSAPSPTDIPAAPSAPPAPSAPGTAPPAPK